MKKSILCQLLFSIITIMLFSCRESDIAIPNNIITSRPDLIVLNDIQIDSLKKATGLQLGTGNSSKLSIRKYSCEWSDGYGGSMGCNGGSCVLVQTSSENGLGCMVNGSLTATGLWRPR